MAQDEKVEGIFGGAVIEAFDTHQGVIEVLEELLKAAKSGEILGFAGAAVHRDQCTSQHYIGFSNQSLIGALVEVQYRLVRYQQSGD